MKPKGSDIGNIFSILWKSFESLDRLSDANMCNAVLMGPL